MREGDDSEVYIFRSNTHRFADISAIREKLCFTKPHCSRSARRARSALAQVGVGAFPRNLRTIETFDAARPDQTSRLDEFQNSVKLGLRYVRLDWRYDKCSIPTGQEKCGPRGIIPQCTRDSVARRKPRQPSSPLGPFFFHVLERPQNCAIFCEKCRLSASFF